MKYQEISARLSLVSRHASKIEVGFITAALFALAYLLRQPLFFGTTTFAHDNFYWNYPIFHFYADTLLSGHLPLWNPYSHAGEAFYPALMQIRLLDPINLFVIFVGRLFTDSLLLLYHWNRLAQSLFMLAGMYLVLRPCCRFLPTRLGLIAILIFSSTLLGSFHADGVINNFLWCPYVIYFALLILRDHQYATRNWIGLALAYGINFQSYFFVLPSVLLLFLGFGFLLFYRKDLAKLLKAPQLFRNLIYASGLICMLAAPNLVLWSEQDRFFYPSRLLPDKFSEISPEYENPPYQGGAWAKLKGVKLPYEAVVYGGSFSSPWDFVQVLAPESNPWIFSFPHQLKSSFGKPSECFIYFGMLGWLFILWGLFFGSHPLKKLWLTLTVGFVLLSLGPNAAIHRILYFFFPPLWFLRHLQFSVLFTSFGFLYFFTLGLDHFFERLDARSPSFQLKLFDGLLLVPVVLFLKWIALGMLNLIPEQSFRLVYWISLSGVFILAVCRYGSRRLAFASVLLSHSLIIYYLHPERTHFLVFLLVLVIIPIALSLIFKKVAGGILLVTLCLDLGVRFVGARSLYEGVEVSALYQGLSKVSATPVPVTQRKLFPHYPPIRLWGSQRPRYIGNILRTGYVFSRVPRNASQDLPLETALQYPWWDALYLPKNYFEFLNSRPTPFLLQKHLGIDGVLFRAAEYEPLLYTLSTYQHNRIAISYTLSKNSTVEWNESYDPYWTASVDEQPFPIQSSEHGFKELLLPAGKHQLVLNYVPYPFLIALLCYYGALSIAIILHLPVSSAFRNRFVQKADWTPWEHQKA